MLPAAASPAAALLFALSTFTAAARADDAASVPSFLRDKPPNFDVDNKKDGYYFTGLPEIGYDPSTGFELGALGDFFVNGPRTSPWFRYAPYRHHVQAQVNFSTLGYQQHYVSYDAPYVFGTPFRVRANVMFERNTSANYFGTGEAAMGPLTFQGRRYSMLAAEEAAAAALAPDGKTASPRYDHYRYDKPSGWLGLERDLRGAGSACSTRPSSSAGGSTPTTATRHRAPTPRDTARRRSRGGPCSGWTASMASWPAARAAGTTCSRPGSPTTRATSRRTRGLASSPTPPASGPRGGSDSSFDYVRLTVSGRFYVSPLRRFTEAVRSAGAGFTLADLVLAGRVLYSMQGGDVPFFVMDTVASTKGDDQGLGGERTLRGYVQDRFIGRNAVVANTELRWNFAHFPLLGQDFALQVAPFFDTGRVFDKVSLALTQWKASAGAGLRIAWNQSTMIMFDVAGSHEDGISPYIDIDLMY